MVVGAGVDQWKPSWYVDRLSPAGRKLAELCAGASSRGGLMSEAVLGHRVGYVASSGLLYAEGHPAAALECVCARERGCECARRLAAPVRLADAYRELTLALGEAGVPVPVGPARWTGERRPATTHWTGELHLPSNIDGEAGVGRVDATVDHRFESPAEGFAVLAGVAAMLSVGPRGQASCRWAKDGSGTIESVTLFGMGGAQIIGRWYDKGLEAGTAPRGTLIRIEDQRRYPKAHRRGARELSEGTYVRDAFARRFEPLWRSTKGVTVAGYKRIADKLVEAIEEHERAVEAGEDDAGNKGLTPRKAESLAGFLLLSSRGARGVGLSRATVMRRKAELREQNLVLAEGGPLGEVEVDIHGVLEEAMDSGRWGEGVKRSPPLERWVWCLRCGRLLTSELSRADGFGLHCLEKLSAVEREQLREHARSVAQLSEVLVTCSRGGALRLVAARVRYALRRRCSARRTRRHGRL